MDVKVTRSYRLAETDALCVVPYSQDCHLENGVGLLINGRGDEHIDLVWLPCQSHIDALSELLTELQRRKAAADKAREQTDAA